VKQVFEGTANVDNSKKVDLTGESSMSSQTEGMKAQIACDFADKTNLKILLMSGAVWGNVKSNKKAKTEDANSLEYGVQPSEANEYIFTLAQLTGFRTKACAAQAKTKDDFEGKEEPAVYFNSGCLVLSHYE
jgi:hypothetical protein